MPRTLYDCSPIDEALAADVLVGVADRASMSCVQRHAVARAGGRGRRSTWYCLVSPPKLDDVDDAGHLLELPLEDPVLGRLQVA